MSARSTAPRLIAITDLNRMPGADLVARARELCLGASPGRVAVLLRDHSASAADRWRWGQPLRRVTRDAGQEFWVADRLDLALLLEADGAHLGEGSVAPAVARRLLGPNLRLSRAWHRADLPSDHAELDEVNALLVSPVLAERHGRAPLGLGTLSHLASEARSRPRPLSLYALGGIEAAGVSACRAAGATGIAAIGAAFSGDLAALLAAIEEG